VAAEGTKEVVEVTMPVETLEAVVGCQTCLGNKSPSMGLMRRIQTDHLLATNGINWVTVGVLMLLEKGKD
jgi:hypothetical protein